MSMDITEHQLDSNGHGDTCGKGHHAGSLDPCFSKLHEASIRLLDVDTDVIAAVLS